MYTATGVSDKEQCLKEFAPLVKRIAHFMMLKLPNSVQIDDLIQAGMIGLLDAAGRYDELRGADWLPRSMRSDMRKIEKAISRAQQRLGKAPPESEIAAELGVSLQDYQQLLQDSRGAQLMYYEDFHNAEDEDFFERYETDGKSNPLEMLKDMRFREALIKAIENLPERERLLMALHYEQDMNLREIGEVLGVGESRVCQLHSQAVTRLRSMLEGH
jgi:RNA polymerase sigma factor for flagellar operon FliA